MTATATPTSPTTTTHAFEADVGRVLDLVINSLYSHKDIFLRELVANASDALDRLRFRALTDADVLEGDSTFEIRIFPDKEHGILRIEDTGIGMTEEEVAKNLGTVAHSGSLAFLDGMTAGAKPDLSLIGQFGVGFYSAYLVAERVDVVTRAAGPGARAVRWSSDGVKTFTLEPAERDKRGTEIILHLRAEQRGLLEEWTLLDLCRRYSDYVSHPIKLERKLKDELKLDQINRASALWRRSKAEITNDEYDGLYKHLTRDLDLPLARTHFKIEGRQEFFGLLYVPRHSLYDVQEGKRRRGLRLFVRRMFVMDDCEEILPSWLRFVRGVIDSDDVPLNVSRETLQDSAVVQAVRKQVIRRTLDMLDELSEARPADYQTFWNAFGAILKEGLALDGGYGENKERIAALVRYESTRGEGLTSLAEYVARAPASQDAIYYIYGPAKTAVAGSPYLEGLVGRGYEVLYMTQAVDEWAAQGIGEFAGKRLVSAMDSNLSLTNSDAEKAKNEEVAATFQPLVERVGKVLGDQVREVRISTRLTDSPCCLVLAPGSTPAYMEQLLKGSGREVPHARRILEVNPAHPLIRNLGAALARDGEAPSIDQWIEVLYGQALLTEGSPIENPNRLAKHIAALLTTATSSP